MSEAENTKKRGIVLQDTSRGEGLISIQGKQYAFDLQTHWRSDMPPIPVQKWMYGWMRVR